VAPSAITSATACAPGSSNSNASSAEASTTAVSGPTGARQRPQRQRTIN
jgi:hypothetical protein